MEEAPRPGSLRLDQPAEGMEAGVPEKLKKNVRAVLLSSPKGVKLQKFCGDYYSLVKERFPWKSLGECRFQQ